MDRFSNFRCICRYNKISIINDFYDSLFYVLQRVDIVFRRLLLEYDYPERCEYDALVFSSLSDDGQHHQEARLCGGLLPDDLYFPNGPIKVQFTTDQIVVKKGFNFHYELNFTPIGKIVLIVWRNLMLMSVKCSIH